MNIKIKSVKDTNLHGKKVLFRPDINSPIDVDTKKIANTNRIQKNAPTLKYMLDNGAAVVIIAHQGDTLDYQNLMGLEEHAFLLSKESGYLITYIDDVCGPTAIKKIKDLKQGECILLANLRYLTEEVSTFEKDVKLLPSQMKDTWLISRLAPLFDLYVNDAFSAAHRNCPSMTGFQQILPSFAGFQFFDEYAALSSVRDNAEHPAIFVLGGAKISDAFGMMSTVLKNGTADSILTLGVTGNVMLAAAGIDIGKANTDFLKSRDLFVFVDQAKDLLSQFKSKIYLPLDVAYEKDGQRVEISIEDLPIAEPCLDIGKKTFEKYNEIIMNAKVIFTNGPAGVYENPLFEFGTKSIINAIAQSPAYSVIGGGDTVTTASKFAKLSDFSYICTAGGAMVRFLSGKQLPLIDAMLGS
ncbi:MAG: phosphoglycerate kinase [Treponemataceae bacterium]